MDLQGHGILETVTRLQYDVAVVGGGQAGVCAALAAAGEGCRTVLVQDRAVLGGNASSECGVPPHGAEATGHNRNCRDTGILERLRLEYYLRRSPLSDTRSHWDLLLKEACDAESNLELLMNTRITSSECDGRSVNSVEGYRLFSEETIRIAAPVFVDATGDGFLAASAGADFRWGREDRSEFGEEFLGSPEADGRTLGCSIYGWAIKRGYPVPFQAPAWATEHGDCESLPNRPHAVDEIFPALASNVDHGSFQFFWWMEWGGHLDVIGDQEVIYRRLLEELFGVWDHLKNRCRPDTRQALENFELYRWSAFPMRRESRRIVGDYILSERDVINPQLFEDRVGVGGWPPDDHPPEGIASTDPPCNQVFLNEPYSIPYRCLYARDVENLFLAGRCISATHAALSSVRVMNTLGALGEAAGTAAALCIQRGATPRGVGSEHIGELQQRLLNRDVYLIGMENRRPDDRAPLAMVDSSSDLGLECGETLGFLDLTYETAVQIPVTSGRIEEIEVFLRAERSAEVGWETYTGSRLGRIEGTATAGGTLHIEAGQDWHRIVINTTTAVDSILTLVLASKDGESVFWGYSEELFQTRWGIRYGTSRALRRYHGLARSAPTDNPWLFVNHHGRLPQDVEEWLEPKNGRKIHRKLFVTPMVRTQLTQSPYAGRNVVNGFDRAESWPNIWISAPGLPQWLSLSWREPARIKQIALIFDTQLDFADQMYGFPRGEDDFAIPCPIRETVRSYRIDVEDQGEWRSVLEIHDNYQRRRVHTLTEETISKQLRLTILETWGVESARLFSIRVFSSA